MYQMYQATEANAARMRREAAEKEAKENTIPAEVRELLKNGEAYIQRIHEANDKIPDEGISDKLYRMERIVTRIFAEVRKDPSLAGNLNMFMDYYLPTTIKLVEAYESMDQQDIPAKTSGARRQRSATPWTPSTMPSRSFSTAFSRTRRWMSRRTSAS